MTVTHVRPPKASDCSWRCFSQFTTLEENKDYIIHDLKIIIIHNLKNRMLFLDFQDKDSASTVSQNLLEIFHCLVKFRSWDSTSTVIIQRTQTKDSACPAYSYISDFLHVPHICGLPSVVNTVHIDSAWMCLHTSSAYMGPCKSIIQCYWDISINSKVR